MQDGTVTANNVTTINVSAGTLTEDSPGTVTLQTGGGSGGALTSKLVVTEPVSWAVSSTWVTNTAWTGRYWRTGKYLNFEAECELSGAPDAVDLEVTLPASLALDETVINTANFNALEIYGSAVESGIGARVMGGRTFSSNTTALKMTALIDFEAITPANPVFQSISDTTPFTWASGDFLYFSGRVPINGWDNTEAVSAGEFSVNGQAANFTPDLAMHNTVQEVDTSGGAVTITFDSLVSDIVVAFVNDGGTNPINLVAGTATLRTQGGNTSVAGDLIKVTSN